MIKMPVLEMFTTLNGEGQFSGKPVVFVRLVGCNIRCKYGASGTCDTPESLLFPHERPVKDWEDLTAKEIAERAVHIAGRICIYTNENIIVEEL